MEPDDLRRLVEYLQARVTSTATGELTFDLPSKERLLSDGLHPDAVHQLLAAPWLEEMVADIRETPDFCSPDEPPERVLGYARDVVEEYVRKRFQL